MNVSELSRKVGMNTVELLEVLPEFGFDIGKRAIKVDDKIASKIIATWPRIRKELEYRKREVEEKKKLLEREMRAAESRTVVIPSVISVRDFATALDVPVADVIKKLISNGVMATLNQQIDFETASIISDEFGIAVVQSEGEQVLEKTIEEKLKKHIEGDGLAVKRAPVIVVMGHVDHGKTSLLDAIRKTDVIAGEAGGITQHIGAYQVEHNGKKISFIDTPGHEAFTAMRSRGARVADIAILVVAADDSIKPQTLEAIKIIKQAGLPMIVAINKIDKEGANIEKVKQDLSQQGLNPEEWGGDTMIQEISAKKMINLDKLLDLIVLVDEMEQDKIVANPNKEAAGTIIEAHMDKGEGPVATVLVQSGTLKVGDDLMVNDVYFGKARSLKNYLGESVKEAGPSMPVKIIGMKFSPNVGDLLEVATGEVSRSAKKVSSFEFHKEKGPATTKVTQAEDSEGENIVERLNVVVKADTLGSLEVIAESLEKLSTSKVKVKILSKGLGNITDTDVMRAETENAWLVGFHVKALPTAQQLAKDKGVEIRHYTVIYNLIDEVRAQMQSLLKNAIVKKVVGTLEVLAIFKTEKTGMILGGKVLSGKILKNSKADVYRNGVLYESGMLQNLQSGKMDVNEVTEGNECGFKYKGSADIQVGDQFQVYTEESVVQVM